MLWSVCSLHKARWYLGKLHSDPNILYCIYFLRKSLVTVDYLERKFLTCSCFIYCPCVFYTVVHKDIISWRFLLEQKVKIDDKKTVLTKYCINLILTIIQKDFIVCILRGAFWSKVCCYFLKCNTKLISLFSTLDFRSRIICNYKFFERY